MNEVKRKREEKAVSFAPDSTRCRSHLLSHSGTPNSCESVLQLLVVHFTAASKVASVLRGSGCCNRSSSS
jgi:hypothetical protein